MTFFAATQRSAPDTKTTSHGHDSRRLITHRTTSCADTREHRSTLAQPHAGFHEPHAARTERARTVWRETLHTRLDSRLLQNVHQPPRPTSRVCHCVGLFFSEGGVVTFFAATQRSAPDTKTTSHGHDSRRMITHCTTSCADTREHRSTLAQPHVMFPRLHLCFFGAALHERG